MIGRRNAQEVGLEASVCICMLYMAIFNIDNEKMGTKTSSQSPQKFCVTICVTISSGNFQSQYTSANVCLLSNDRSYLLLPFNISEHIQNQDLSYTAKLEENLILVCKIIQEVIAVEGFPPLKDGMQLYHGYIKPSSFHKKKEEVKDNNSLQEFKYS